MEGGEQPAGGIKDLYDPGLVKLRKTLDRDLRDTSDRNTWYNTIRPRALAERSRTQALVKATGRQSASIF